MASIMNLYFSTFDEYALIYGKEKLLHACQVGSFMEFYSTETEGPDLQKLSEILNIVVSRKDKSISKIDRSNPYMMGYPLVSHQKFLKIMLDNGYVVVVTEQVTPPPSPLRKVTGVYTPGTNIDDYSHQNNYLMGIYVEQIGGKYVIGTSLIDVSTGEVYVYETFTVESYDEYYPLDDVVTMYKNYNPKEVILLYNNVDDIEKLVDYFECKRVLYYCKQLGDTNIGSVDKIKYQLELFHKVYPDVNKNILFEELDLDKTIYARIVFSFSLNYIYNHNKTLLTKLNIPKQLKIDDNLYLGNNALQQLNVFSSGGLYKIINQTKTNMGSRYLKKQLNEPTFNIKTLQQRYDLIDNIIKDNTLEKLEEKLNFNDVEKLHRKIELNLIHPMEFYTWYENIQKGISLLNYLDIEKGLVSKLKTIISQIETTYQVEELKKFILTDIHNRIFKSDLYPDLETLLININSCTDFMDELANFITNTLPKGQNTIKVNKNDREGHYISLTTKRAELLQNLLKGKKYIELGDIKIASSSLEFKVIGKGATTKIFAPELRMNSNKLNDYIDQIKSLNRKYYIKFLNNVIVPETKCVHKLIDTIGFWDFIYSGAKCVTKYNYIKPTLVDSDKSFVDVKDMRHPIIENISTQIFIPMSIILGKDEQDCILLYGLNSAGKSTLQKALGLNIIMAQIGYYVPCSSFEFNPYHSLLTRINSNDNIFKGQSSFTLELAEIKAILKRSSQNTLVIADEVCKGTEHDSSLIVVMSIIEMLSKNKTSLITASHLHELSHSKRLQNLSNVKLYHIHIDFDESTNTIVYNRELRTGSGENFYGLNIAKYLMNDAEFNNIVNDIKSEFTNDCIIGEKWSKYNSKLNINKCAVCGYFPNGENEKPLEVHHINFQKHADVNGFIRDKHFHKNHISNLVVLCSQCHDKIDTKELVISGYTETSKGHKLIWETN